jgi:23S rRNA pseudouridine1911/1915/1917 synthase
VNDVVSPEIVRLVATAAQASQRLDKVLGAVFGSRAQAQALLHEKLVRVGGIVRKASYLLRPGDVVEAVTPARPSGGGLDDPQPEALPLAVLYEDPHILVVNKSSGTVVHPAPGHRGGTLVNALLHHLGSRPGGGAAGRPGIVHRLDKETSGVLVVAKTAGAHEGLCRQFRQRTIRKEYVAVVRGRMAARDGIIDRPIGRHPRERKRMSIRTRRGRASVTRYVVRDAYEAASVVHLYPETGRTHQIRVHLATLGHAVVGDRLYGRPRGRMIGAEAAIRDALARFPRQALHAASLEFVHPATGEAIRVEAPLPPDMEHLIAVLHGGYGAAA